MIPHALLVILLGQCERERSDVIALLREENRALKARSGRRLRLLNDQERPRLADYRAA